jgi:hypothetical protein
MADGVENGLVGLGGLVPAAQVIREAAVRQAPNGVHYAAFGDNTLDDNDLERMVQAVPVAIAGALTRKTYYFVPLALSESRGSEATVVAAAYSAEIADQAICHRNVTLGETDGVFISARLLARPSLRWPSSSSSTSATPSPPLLEFPMRSITLVWSQAVADVRGETSQDAWESRNLALTTNGKAEKIDGKPVIDEKAKNSFLESAFSDAVAIYQLSLSVDFDYSELREREYPLLAPQALAERLRLVAKLFPPNPTYEFSIRYRRRA